MRVQQATTDFAERGSHIMRNAGKLLIATSSLELIAFK